MKSHITTVAAVMMMAATVYARTFGDKSSAGRVANPTTRAAAHEHPPSPPMGWNPWNAFRTEVTEDKILSVANAMIKDGLADAGYRYINVDDGWWLKRDTQGRIAVRRSMFPRAVLPRGGTSLRPFVDHLHSMGLLAGLYTDIGRNACSQAWDRTSPNLPTGSMAEREVGSMDHQAQDMRLIFGEWNFDFLKVDACGLADFGPEKPYVRDGMFRATGPFIVRGHPVASSDNQVKELYASLKRNIDEVRPTGNYVLSICTWGEANADEWAKGYGTIWRTSADIQPTWRSMLANLDSATMHARSAGPGHWNDPDMLEIGNGEFDANHLVEARSHLSLWAIISAPLLLGSDVTRWPASLVAIAGNREVIAIDQDPAGAQGVVIARSGAEEVIVKRLNDGSKVVALLNRSDRPLSLSFPISRLHLTGVINVRDIWKAEEYKASKFLKAELAPRETVLLRIKSTSERKHAAIYRFSTQRFDSVNCAPSPKPSSSIAFSKSSNTTPALADIRKVLADESSR